MRRDVMLVQWEKAWKPIDRRLSGRSNPTMTEHLKRALVPIDSRPSARCRVVMPLQP